jgi:hypothetical protein
MTAKHFQREDKKRLPAFHLGCCWYAGNNIEQIAARSESLFSEIRPPIGLGK